MIAIVSNMALFPVRIVLSCMISLSASISNVTPWPVQLRARIRHAIIVLLLLHTFRRNLPGILSRTPWHFPRNGILLFNDPRRSFEKSSRPPQSKLLAPPHPPFFSCSLSNEILPRIHPGIKISSATSLFSQLRNPSRKRANSANNRAFSRPSPVKEQKIPFSPILPPRCCSLMSAAFRDSFPPPFLFLISSAPFPFLTSHQTCIGIHGWAFGCIVIITVTRYNEDTLAPLTRRVTRVVSSRAAVFRVSKPRGEISSEFGRICLVGETTKRSLRKLWMIFGWRQITRTGIVGYAIDRNRFRGNRMIAARSGSNRRTARIKRFEFLEYSIGIRRDFSFPLFDRIRESNVLHFVDD